MPAALCSIFFDTQVSALSGRPQSLSSDAKEQMWPVRIAAGAKLSASPVMILHKNPANGARREALPVNISPLESMTMNWLRLLPRRSLRHTYRRAIHDHRRRQLKCRLSTLAKIRMVQGRQGAVTHHGLKHQESIIQMPVRLTAIQVRHNLDELGYRHMQFPRAQTSTPNTLSTVCKTREPRPMPMARMTLLISTAGLPPVKWLLSKPTPQTRVCGTTDPRPPSSPVRVSVNHAIVVVYDVEAGAFIPIVVVYDVEAGAFIPIVVVYNVGA
ncbi:hypothetical protein B0H13DRAFT_2272999, partial [Mycena leptocephala]